jgi:hypothetical protein
MKPWVLNQLKQPSTWRGLVWILTVFGVLLTPEQTEAIVLAGMAVAGLLGVFLNDAPQTVKIELPPIDLVGAPASGRLRDPVPPEFDSKIDGHGFGDK